jgi:YQGE family putative transporter
MIGKELIFFKSHPLPMRVLLLTNLIYALVLPIIELFIGAYIMRNSSDISLVVIFQLALYIGIPATFALNGFLLNYFKISRLYSLGMLLSGISMAAMMSLDKLTTWGIFGTGLIMGLSYGFFWANRDFLALNTTNNDNRNYYYGIETFFYTIAGIIIPFGAGAFIASTKANGWFAGNINVAYYCLAGFVFTLTVVSSILVHRGHFENPAKTPFIFFKFHPLWYKMLSLSVLKGVAQGYIVTAPVMLIRTLVGEEGSLGTILSIAAFLSAILLYILGKIDKAGTSDEDFHHWFNIVYDWSNIQCFFIFSSWSHTFRSMSQFCPTTVRYSIFSDTAASHRFCFQQRRTQQLCIYLQS